MRFKYQIGLRLGCHPSSVDAMVLGEHDTSQVYVWSTAQVGGKPVFAVAEELGWQRDAFRAEVEHAVRYAHINIIEGTGASRHDIGIVTARIVGTMLCDDGFVAPVGALRPKYGVTQSLPSVIGRTGITTALSTPLSAEEEEALQRSADVIRSALTDLA